MTQIPWEHNIVIISKCKTHDEAFFYLQKTIQNNWSRSVLTHHIESNLFKREGKSITNFQATLPTPQSDLARKTPKDPYNFDFLTLTEKHNERELEDALVNHVARFLKSEQDNATIGILICKSKNDTVVEYALKDVHKPIGVSEYIITKNLPDEFKSSLPSIEEIEAELSGE